MQWAFVHPLACNYIKIKCPFSERSKWYFQELVGESGRDRDYAEEALCTGHFDADTSSSRICRNLLQHFYTECGAQVTFKFNGTDIVLDSDDPDSSLCDFENTRNQALEEAFNTWIPTACTMPSFTDSTPLIRADGKTTTQLQLRDLPGSGGKGGFRPASTLQEAFRRAMEAEGPNREWITSGATPEGYWMTHGRETKFWGPKHALAVINESRDWHRPGELCGFDCPVCPPAAAAPVPMEEDAGSNPPRSGRSIVPR